MVSSLLKFFFGRGDPTRDWRPYDGRSLRVEIDDRGSASLNRVRLGAPLESLAFLGPAEAKASYDEYEVRYYSLGLCIRYEDEGGKTFDSLQLVYRDQTDDKHAAFGGVVEFQGQTIDPAGIDRDEWERRFGESREVDEDEEETILFYSFDSADWEIEFGTDGVLNRWIVIGSEEE